MNDAYRRRFRIWRGPDCFPMRFTNQIPDGSTKRRRVALLNRGARERSRSASDAVPAVLLRSLLQWACPTGTPPSSLLLLCALAASVACFCLFFTLLYLSVFQPFVAVTPSSGPIFETPLLSYLIGDKRWEIINSARFICVIFYCGCLCLGIVNFSQKKRTFTYAIHSQCVRMNPGRIRERSRIVPQIRALDVGIVFSFLLDLLSLNSI